MDTMDLYKHLLCTECRSTAYVPQESWDNFYYYLLFHPKYLLWTLFNLDIFKIPDDLHITLKNAKSTCKLSLSAEQIDFIEKNIAKIPKKALAMVLYATRDQKNKFLLSQNQEDYLANNINADIFQTEIPLAS